MKASKSKYVTWPSMRSQKLTITALTIGKELYICTYVCMCAPTNVRKKALRLIYARVIAQTTPSKKSYSLACTNIYTYVNRRKYVYNYIEIYRYDTLIYLTSFVVIYSRVVFVHLRTHIHTYATSAFYGSLFSLGALCFAVMRCLPKIDAHKKSAYNGNI